MRPNLALPRMALHRSDALLTSAKAHRLVSLVIKVKIETLRSEGSHGGTATELMSERDVYLVTKTPSTSTSNKNPFGLPSRS